jgi:hypothetical protein
MGLYRYVWCDKNYESEKRGYLLAKDTKMAEQKVRNNLGDGHFDITYYMDESQMKELLEKGFCLTYSD